MGTPLAPFGTLWTRPAATASAIRAASDSSPALGPRAGEAQPDARANRISRGDGCALTEFSQSLPEDARTNLPDLKKTDRVVPVIQGPPSWL
jgi:hypothetical protein